MRIAYVNTYYQHNHTGGGHVHMGQFVQNAKQLGHEIWSYPNNLHPDVHTIPTSRLSHIRTMRKMDALYVRIESSFPETCAWSLPPRRLLYNLPVVIWEFNTTPEHGLLRGQSEKHVNQVINSLSRYGRGCDLAICMTHDLADYVRNKIGVRRVLIVPNGSDPQLFHPEVSLVPRMNSFQDKFNVVWIGSAKETWHDFKLLAETAEKIWKTKKGKEILFHIIGPDLTGMMAEMTPNVYYWGAEYYERLPNWLAGMHVGLNIYHPGAAFYAAPLKVFDYMSSGLAVVSTPLPFMENLLNQLGQSELLVKPGDSKKLADLLIRLSSDKERVHRQGQAGRELVIKYYNWKRAVEDTMAEIETILVELKAPRHK